MIATPFLNEDYWLDQNELAFVWDNQFPVAEGHRLILPKRVVVSPTDISPEEMLCIFELMKSEKAKLELQGYSSFTWGWNDGLLAGQTVAHVHLHLIPRVRGDVEKAKGGICNIFTELSSYYSNK